jgi:SAM-dependent methyltransferase
MSRRPLASRRGSTRMAGGGPPRRGGSSAEHRARWAATYAETPYDGLPWFTPDPSKALEEAVHERFLAPGSAVLDIGCGAGTNVLFLAQQGFEAHGVDLAPDAVRAARARARSAGVTVDVREGDALALEYPDARFGGLVDIGCFHTLPPRRRPDYAREVARVLAPGGAFVLSWIAREHTGERGPPHRPSLGEVADALEGRFLFTRSRFRPPGEETGPAVYDAWLTRRATPQPPRR